MRLQLSLLLSPLSSQLIAKELVGFENGREAGAKKSKETYVIPLELSR
jgi:hypothetical protein